MALKEDYKDQVLDTSVNVNRTYNVIDRNNRVLYTDVQLRETTVFSEDGDDFGANDVNAITAAINAQFDMYHPVGSLFPTTDPTFNPNSAPGWHGTWERIKDCMIYAAGDSDTVGAIVGSNTHYISVSELPSHTHIIPALSGTASGGNHYHLSAKNFNVSAGAGATAAAGDWGEAHSDGSVSTKNSGNLSMSVTTTASTTGAKGDGTSVDMRSRRINACVWKRIS